MPDMPNVPDMVPTDSQMTFSWSSNGPVTGVTPILKWVGGKKWLVNIAAQGIRRRLAATDGRYIEPFLGGGAMALAVGCPGMWLSDLCEPLINTYKAVVADPFDVYGALHDLAIDGVDETSYYRVRASQPMSSAGCAARFIYLNKLNYNGLYRVNRHGVYNVPYGHKFADGENPFSRSIDGSPKTTHNCVSGLFPDLVDLRAVANALESAEIDACDFEKILALAEPSDVIFADPPYANAFGAYTSKGFDEDAQQELAQSLRRVSNTGTKFITTNTDIAIIRALYQWAQIIPVKEARSVSCDGAKRKRVGCVIITNDPSLLTL